ncbi:hypothetical protein JMJ55_00730 [Belnapia sp. T6]|uniref:Uncharacterized protein n=1 Tax=Belnapia mucosa TaxID=2804532 RepID=A0ABS1UWH8_9PROT|nr:hypothetical protein [Belnapia mucosa]MBL6453824.1 hypothetical protein [Belnapia mucosa]
MPHPSLLLLAALFAALFLANPALAQTPAERASRQLNQETQRDRVVDRAEAAREAPAVVPPAQVLPLESDRSSLRPDVGRPEEAGRIGTGNAGMQPGLNQNTQR